jgi:hypothetical protein
MTSVLVPDFIINLYEDETKKVIHQVLDHLCDRYNLKKTEVVDGVEKNINMKLEIIPETKEDLVIVKRVPRTPPPEGERCIARLKKNGAFCQCGFRVKNNPDYCTRHFNAFKEDKLKYDTVNDELPVENLGRRRKKIY